MLRYGLLGGARPPLPWEFFISMGGAAIAAGLVVTALFPLWSTYPELGLLETGIFLGAGGILLAVGLRRKRGGPKLP